MTEHVCKGCGNTFDASEEGWIVVGDYYYCSECADDMAEDTQEQIIDGERVCIVREKPEIERLSAVIPPQSEEPPVERIQPDYEAENEAFPLTRRPEPDDSQEEPKEEPEQKRSDLKSKLKDRFKRPSDGTLSRRRGTAKPKKEKEYDVDSLHERFRRWQLIHKENYVIFKKLTREPDGEYFLDTTLIPMSELPKEAVAVTNEKYTYCLDTIRTSKWYLETHTDPYEDYYESQFTASDAALYMNSNKIDNALAIKWTEFSHVDFKRYIPLAIAGLAVVLFLIMKMRG